jgi:hypothetical protein
VLADVAGLAGGGFVVVWQEGSALTTDAQIRARRYDAAGNKQGGEITVSAAAAFDFTFPSVTALNDGGFYVTLTQDNAGPDNYILGAVYDADGVFVRSQTPALAFGKDNFSDVARLGSGSIVAWSDPDSTSGEIAYRVFDGLGTGGTGMVANTATTGTQDSPAVATAPNGNTAAIVWFSSPAAGDTRIKGRLFGSSGAEVAPEFQIGPAFAGTSVHTPAVVWLNDYEFAVAWTEVSTPAFGGAQIKVQIFNILGGPATAVTGAIGVNSTSIGTQQVPQITVTSNGGFVIAWEDFSQTGGDDSGFGIRLQAFDGAGGKIGGEILVNTTAIGDQFNASISALGDGRVVVTWTDTSGATSDVRMQIIDPRDGIVTGTSSGDVLYGHDAVNDEISGFHGADLLRGLAGNDQLYGGGDNDDMFGGKDNDALYGGAGVDTLLGEAGDDDLYGEDGNDDLRGGAGADNFDGGAGIDAANYGASATGVTVALDGSLAATGEATGDSFASVEYLKGAAGSGDTLRGDGGANALYGNAGNDNLNGMAGHDKLVGGLGTDTLTGGTGNDQFIYNLITELPDALTDFSSNVAGNNDLFLFKGSVFGGLPSGALPAAQFQSSTANVATNGSIRFFYETDTRILRFDADDSGGGSAPLVVATLQVGATMTFDDISIF